MFLLRRFLKIILAPVSLALLVVKGVVHIAINLTSAVVRLFLLYVGFNSTGEYSKKILEVNDMLYDFATICYSKGNYMLLPAGARAMNNQRYLFTEDRIDAILYQCFGKGIAQAKHDGYKVDWVKFGYRIFEAVLIPMSEERLQCSVKNHIQ